MSPPELRALKSFSVILSGMKGPAVTLLSVQLAPSRSQLTEDAVLGGCA